MKVAVPITVPGWVNVADPACASRATPRAGCRGCIPCGAGRMSSFRRRASPPSKTFARAPMLRLRGNGGGFLGYMALAPELPGQPPPGGERAARMP